MAQPTTHHAPSASSAASSSKGRQLVSFAFYKVDPEWRRLPKKTRKEQADELLDVVNACSKKLMVLTYSLAGTRGDVDFMIWRVGPSVEALQEMAAAIQQTAIAGYLTIPHHYLSMTKRSTYVDKLDPDHPDKRRFIEPFHSKYLFVYPFVKTWEWYALPMPERQEMMDEHIVMGNKYPSVKIHTTYAFGLDDPEFVLGFETDSAEDFLDLVMEMRGSKARKYTLLDTPIFTCVAKPFRDVLADLGGGA